MSESVIISPTYAEVDLGAIRSNVRLIKERTAPGKVMAVVKANAYGHGLRGIARILAGIGIDYFGVSQVREGIAIREEGLSVPTLVLGPLLSEEIIAALNHKLEIAVTSVVNAEEVSRTAQQHGQFARIHLKIDTGMGRVGFNWKRAAEEIAGIINLPHLVPTGIFMHFAAASNTHFAKEQLNHFYEVLFQLEKQKIVIPLRHAANSGALLNLPEALLDMIRTGIMIYGHYPSQAVVKDFPLQPAMTLRSRVKQLKEVEAGTGISYGLSYKTESRTAIASIPVGYGDGYSRALSNKG